MKSKNSIHSLVGMAVFSALAVVIALVCQIIPPVAGFLSLDIKDAVIAMASFIYGPISAPIIAFAAAFIEAITFSTTGWYGFIMNFASSAVFSLTASLIYKKFRTLNGALFGFISAVILTTGVMLVLNTFVTPLYMQYMGFSMTRADVIAMIPKILMPFNFSKALLNSAVAMLLYKPLSVALSRIGFGDKRMNFVFNRNSVIILVAGTVALLVAITILLLI